jgi:hypothetical protein
MMGEVVVKSLITCVQVRRAAAVHNVYRKEVRAVRRAMMGERADLSIQSHPVNRRSENAQHTGVCSGVGDY